MIATMDFKMNLIIDNGDTMIDLQRRIGMADAEFYRDGAHSGA